MTEKIINEDYTIDLDSVHTDAHCPYCEGELFSGVAVEVVAPDDPTYPDGVFENTCLNPSCGAKSVWMENAQYKIVA